jgi:hypothetical protein
VTRSHRGDLHNKCVEMLSRATHRISSCLRWARAFWGTAVSRLTSNLRCRNEASPCSDSGSSWSISLRSKRLCLFWDGDLFQSLRDRIKPLWTLSYFELHLHKATHKCRSLSTLMKLASVVATWNSPHISGAKNDLVRRSAANSRERTLWVICRFRQFVAERIVWSIWTQKKFDRAFQELSNDVFGHSFRSRNMQMNRHERNYTGSSETNEHRPITKSRLTRCANLADGRTVWAGCGRAACSATTYLHKSKEILSDFFLVTRQIGILTNCFRFGQQICN